jgi:hypothetical protein
MLFVFNYLSPFADEKIIPQTKGLAQSHQVKWGSHNLTLNSLNSKSMFSPTSRKKINKHPNLKIATVILKDIPQKKKEKGSTALVIRKMKIKTE